jgi:hypothetical protein
MDCWYKTLQRDRDHDCLSRNPNVDWRCQRLQVVRMPGNLKHETQLWIVIQGVSDDLCSITHGCSIGALLWIVYYSFPLLQRSLIFFASDWLSNKLRTYRNLALANSKCVAV